MMLYALLLTKYIFKYFSQEQGIIGRKQNFSTLFVLSDSSVLVASVSPAFYSFWWYKKKQGMIMFC